MHRMSFSLVNQHYVDQSSGCTSKARRVGGSCPLRAAALQASSDVESRAAWLGCGTQFADLAKAPLHLQRRVELVKYRTLKYKCKSCTGFSFSHQDTVALLLDSPHLKIWCQLKEILVSSNSSFYFLRCMGYCAFSKAILEKQIWLYFYNFVIAYPIIRPTTYRYSNLSAAKHPNIDMSTNSLCKFTETLLQWQFFQQILLGRQDSSQSMRFALHKVHYEVQTHQLLLCK